MGRGLVGVKENLVQSVLQVGAPARVSLMKRFSLMWRLWFL